MNLIGRSFLTLKDFTPEEITYLLDLAAELKDKKKKGVPVDDYRGKNVALIFEKTSTRTRCSFEVAAHDMGMGTTYLDPKGSQIGKKESIRDTARVLGRMYDGIEYRGFGQEIVEELAKYAGVPVWNGLTNEYHPTQMLADLLTIREHFGKLKGIKLVYMGDARYNMGNSLMIACSKMGMDFVACTTEKYFPAKELVETCQGYAAQSGGTITLTEDVAAGTKGADVIYTDVWVSMGEPDEVWEERIRELSPYKVTKEVMENAGEQAIFLHCLPAFHDLGTVIGKEIYDKYGIRDMEVTDEVFESDQSKVFDEAENRMHTIQSGDGGNSGKKRKGIRLKEQRKGMYEEKVVLCGANSYTEKYYLNPDFEQLPESIKNELKILCVLYVHDVGGILTLVFEENGELCFEVTSEEGDPMFDEIGSRLKIKQIQQEKQDLLQSLQLYYQVFFLGEELE